MKGRSLADLSDRHYSLFANNQHPIQLTTYNQYNAFLQRMHDKKEAQNDEALAARFEEVAHERQAALNSAEGESLTLDVLSDIYIQVKGEARDQHNMALQTRDKKGDIADYLESRRPFGTEPSASN